MRNCKVIFTKRRNGGERGADGGSGGHGRVCAKLFCDFAEPVLRKRKEVPAPSRSARGEGREALTGAADWGEGPEKQKPAEAK